MAKPDYDKELMRLKAPYDRSYVDGYEANQIIEHLVDKILDLELRLRSIHEMGG